MTQSETASVLALLRAAYPSFYRNMSGGVMDDVLALWYEMFRSEDVRVVKAALRRLIATHTGFPPDIAAVRKYIEETEACVNGDPTDEELWEIFRHACTDGIYHAQQQFDALPGILKRYAGSPATIHELALSSVETMNTVTKGQFFRALPGLRERMRCEDSFRDALPGAEGRPALTPEEKEARSLRLLAALGVQTGPGEGAAR